MQSTSPTVSTCREDSEQLLSPTETALIIGIDQRTLANWRVAGRGPRFTKMGRNVRYTRAAVQEFIHSNTFSNTREAAQAQGV
ncbi:helix-turn-helix domain-containing protein [Spongiibacter tropicus]|uniref:helix-turn-helix domain-containing protein n=1 Tax=Spongiibacter tropicus TaxID=454602 RepID=UPI0035BE2548